jgi:hypothetical protein
MTSYNGSDTNDELSCTTVTLFNGVSIQIPAIPWITGFLTVGLAIAVSVLGVVAGAAGVAAGVVGVGTAGIVGGVSHGAHAARHLGHTISEGVTHIVDELGSTAGALSAPHASTVMNAHSGPPAGRLDAITLFLQFQFIASTGLLSINFPPLYSTFTANFAWANFIIPINAFRRAASHLQGHCNTTTGTGSSPYIPHISSGIATYAAHLGLQQFEVSGTTYFVFLCACGALVVLTSVVTIVIQILALTSKSKDKEAKWISRRHRWVHMSSNNTLRLVGRHSSFTFPILDIMPIPS